MMLSSGMLAVLAQTETQQRTLARYTFLYGDSLLLWVQRWRNELKRANATERRANHAKPTTRDFARVLASVDGVRDYLAAKRQPAASFRPDDVEATVRLWESVNLSNTVALCQAGGRAYDTLNGTTDAQTSVSRFLALAPEVEARLRKGLPPRDETCWRIAADTAADLRENTVPVAQGGDLGRLIAQINDIAGHLDVLLELAPAAYGIAPYDWLVRSAFMVELNALFDLVLGPPPGRPRTATQSLLGYCRTRTQTATAAIELRRLRESIGTDGWCFIRDCRNVLGAHVDDHLSAGEIHQVLADPDYQGLCDLAVHAINWLDALGATQLDLKALLFGDKRIAYWPTDPAVNAPGRPSRPIAPGTLAALFRSIDSPFITVAGTNHAASVVAGITAGRRPAPRGSVHLPPFDRYCGPRF